jgi:hypothetical protein
MFEDNIPSSFLLPADHPLTPWPPCLKEEGINASEYEQFEKQVARFADRKWS